MAAPGRSLSQPITEVGVQTALRKQRMPQLQRPPCDPVAIRVRGGSNFDEQILCCGGRLYASWVRLAHITGAASNLALTEVVTAPKCPPRYVLGVGGRQFLERSPLNL